MHMKISCLKFTMEQELDNERYLYVLLNLERFLHMIISIFFSSVDQKFLRELEGSKKQNYNSWIRILF